MVWASICEELRGFEGDEFVVDGDGDGGDVVIRCEDMAI